MTTTHTEKQAKNASRTRAKSGSSSNDRRRPKTKTGAAPKPRPAPPKARAARVDAQLQSKVQDYLDRFCDAMTSGDTTAVASLWAIPSFVVDKKDARAILDAAEVEQFFRGAPEMYAQRGIDDTRAEIQTLDVIEETLVMVTVRWPYIDAEGEEIGDESSTYTLKADDSGEFKMCVCTMRGENPDETQTDTTMSH